MTRTSPPAVSPIAVFEPSAAILRALAQHFAGLVALCDAEGRMAYISRG
jgi:hypothetical protein